MLTEGERRDSDSKKKKKKKKKKRRPQEKTRTRAQRTSTSRRSACCTCCFVIIGVGCSGIVIGADDVVARLYGSALVSRCCGARSAIVGELFVVVLLLSFLLLTKRGGGEARMLLSLENTAFIVSVIVTAGENRTDI